MGKIVVPVAVSSVTDPTRSITFDAMVDTGAFGLILPSAWKEALGPLPEPVAVEIETADQRVVPANVCGPVRIQVGEFRRVFGEVIFIDMQPGVHGYEPLVGYTILELCGIVIDMVSHQLVARQYFDVKRTSPRAGAGGTLEAR